MPITIGVPKETTPGERRVALVPDVAKKLIALGAALCIERGAGAAASFRDEDYAGAAIGGFTAES